MVTSSRLSLFRHRSELPMLLRPAALRGVGSPALGRERAWFRFSLSVNVSVHVPLPDSFCLTDFGHGHVHGTCTGTFMERAGLLSGCELADLVEAAVDDKRLTRDEGRIVAREECHGAGHVPRLCHSLDRLERPYRSARLCRQGRRLGRFGE